MDVARWVDDINKLAGKFWTWRKTGRSVGKGKRFMPCSGLKEEADMLLNCPSSWLNP